ILTQSHITLTLFPYTTLFRSVFANITYYNKFLNWNMYFYLMAKSLYHILGVMSGTSCDGIDLAEVNFTYLKNSWEYSIKNTGTIDRKSTRLNSSHVSISYAVF